MSKISISYIVSLLLVSAVFGQFGNEWINPNQSYYTFKIASDGFYRIDQSELAALGFPIENVPASRIQLFREGQEIALNVVTNANGTLDYLEFYGRKKDGTSDIALYETGEQPHTYYNLFTDSASYFLTYQLGSVNGKRMSFSADKNATGLTPEAYHLEDTIQLFNSVYSSGYRFGAGSSFSLSSYDEGEAWTGGFQGKNAFKDFSFSLNNKTADINARFETVLIGGNSLLHNARVSAGPNASSLTTIDNIQFARWDHQFYSSQIPDALVGLGGELIVRVLAEGFPEAAERFSVSYMRIIFSQSVHMKSTENKLFELDNKINRKAWLQIATSNAPGTRVFDVTDPNNVVRMATTNFSDRVEVVVPDVQIGNRLLAVTNTKSVGQILPVTLPNYDLSNVDYLIITHELLRILGDPVNDYKQYRESVEGGGHTVEIANINDLYNVFGYGDPSPLAIRNFILYANSQNPVYNVFIIGKGFTPNYDYYRGSQAGVNVPTYGLPGTDGMYTLGINAQPEISGIPIGRLNATEAQQVLAYLNKVKEMEATPFDDLYRKDFLQLSGGISQAEINAYELIISGFTTYLEDDFIGGRAFNTGKETSESVEFIDVSNRINEGVGYVTFFGHSSGTVTDIEVGRVSNPEFGFANKGKYPIFLVNGCQAGEIFGTNFTFGEDWILTPDLGAVGFIAHTSSASSSTLRRWSNLFYRVGFGDEVFIGRSLGEVMGEVSNQYLTAYGNSESNLSQLQQMQLQGDPAYRLFGADFPDYQVDESSLSVKSILGEEVLVAQDSFRVDIVVKNFGRTVSDSLKIQFNRIYPDGSQEIYVEQFLRPLRQDTIQYYLLNDPSLDSEGSNSITVILDPENETQELNESNNTASITVDILRGSSIHLFPMNNGIQSEQMVNFIWQSSNALEEYRSYDLEIDTQADFNGSNNRSFTVVGEVLLKYDFDFSDLALADSTTIYWRTRFTNPLETESNEWVVSSFTLINNVQKGWGQYQPEQVGDGLITGTKYNQVSNQWEFIQTTNPIDIFTFGVDNASFSLNDMKAIINGIDFFVTSNTIDPTCENNTFNAIAFDKESGDPYRPIVTQTIDVFNREVCGRLPQRIYQFREIDLIGANRRLEVMVNNMRDGDQIVLFNIGRVDYSNWDAPLLATLSTIGISATTIASLTDGQPVIFFGKKGSPPGSATVVLNDGTATPITEQSIGFQENVIGRFTSGKILSKRIGPARDWQSFSYALQDELNDSYSLDLYGITPNGVKSELVTRGRLETIDIASIDPITYPELELFFLFFDEIDQTPPQLQFWQINYSLPPEGFLVPADKERVSVPEGAPITKSFRWVNVSNVDFTDSLTVFTHLINQDNGTDTEKSFKIPPPMAQDTIEFDVSFSSFDMTGLNSMIVLVQANEPEMYNINNRITLQGIVEVQPDETNPILDVTFDGYHILDGDIVSSNPTISIKMRDDNPFALKTDTLGFNISLRLPGESSQYERINFSDPRLSYRPATPEQDFEIDFQPGPLMDGKHAIRIQVEDDAGNNPGANPYEINFEVITESTVTHFYPYPNPFSTSCRFVFTLTGSEIPDQVKIQIMTVSGRIVREITQDEIGPIRIGNNITTYAWDGRDEYGDQLANGVYFYKVFINSNGNEVSQRATSADKAFKNGFGKLYILR